MDARNRQRKREREKGKKGGRERGKEEGEREIKGKERKGKTSAMDQKEKTLN